MNTSSSQSFPRRPFDFLTICNVSSYTVASIRSKFNNNNSKIDFANCARPYAWFRTRRKGTNILVLVLLPEGPQLLWSERIDIQDMRVKEEDALNLTRASWWVCLVSALAASESAILASELSYINVFLCGPVARLRPAIKLQDKRFSWMFIVVGAGLWYRLHWSPWQQICTSMPWISPWPKHKSWYLSFRQVSLPGKIPLDQSLELELWTGLGLGDEVFWILWHSNDTGTFQ